MLSSGRHREQFHKRNEKGWGGGDNGTGNDSAYDRSTDNRSTDNRGADNRSAGNHCGRPVSP